MKLTGRVAIITGSSRGIGKATAMLFAREGAKVVINSNESTDEAKATLDEIKKLGAEAIYIQADVSVESSVEAMMNQVHERFGKIDILVNNAGIVYDLPFDERTTEQWQRTLDVNLNGVYYCCKHVKPFLTDRSVIINTASSNGVDTYFPTSIDYDVSKAGVILFTKALAVELAPKTRVNGINPGWIDTQMNADLPAEDLAEEVKKIGLGRLGKPEEIANGMLFLASDDASYISGTILTIDGAYH